MKSIAVIVFSLAVCGASNAQSFSVDSIGDGISYEPEPEIRGINVDGHATGWMLTNQTQYNRGFFYNGAFTDLGYISQNTNVEGFDVNASNVVCGYAGSGTQIYPVKWSSGTFTTLGKLNDEFAVAVAINSSGNTAGYYRKVVENVGTFDRACKWLGTSISSIPLIGSEGEGRASRATDINSGGAVCGYCFVGGVQHAFVYSSGGTLTDITPDTESGCDAVSINDSGWVLGNGFPDAEAPGSVWIWDGSTFIYLEEEISYQPNPVDYDGIQLVGMNNDGDSVGYIWLDLPNGPDYDAIMIEHRSNGTYAMWNTDGIMNSDTVEREFQRAAAINDSNQITINGWDTTLDALAFILTPASTSMALSTAEPVYPGSISNLECLGCTPGRTVTFVRGFDSGSTAVSGCSGLFIDIANPTVMGSAVADTFGRAQLSASVPCAAAGLTIRLQAVENTCRKSNVDIVTVESDGC